MTPEYIIDLINRYSSKNNILFYEKDKMLLTIRKTMENYDINDIGVIINIEANVVWKMVSLTSWIDLEWRRFECIPIADLIKSERAETLKELLN
jgi:hypothetical protein